MGLLTGAVILALVLSPAAFAAISASATITNEQQIGPNNWEYTLSLTNTGGASDPSISTFWFGWAVYIGSYVYDLLPSAPTNITSPSGWTGLPQHDGLNPSANSVEWYTGTPLAPGQTASGFKFDSADNPTVINAATSPAFSLYPTRESWAYQNVYAGIANSGANVEFTPSIAPAPEPGLAILLPGLLLIRTRRRTGHASIA
jgi:hypothetical protein